MFTTPFDSYICDGDSITCELENGYTATATIYLDTDCDEPWKMADGHGPVSEWTSRPKRPGERILNQDRRSYRYYDFQAAVALARADKWDAPPFGQGTPGQRAVRAAEADFKVLKAWCEDEWQYYGVAVTISKADVELTDKYDHALWGIEGNYPGSDNSYFLEVANERLEEALKAAQEKAKEICAELCNCD